MLSASQRILFLRAILACPPLLPTVYARDSDDKQKSSTKLEPSQVPGNVVPKVLMLEAADTMLHPLKMAFSDFLSSLEFPDDMLDEGSLVRQSHRDAMLQAERVAPSGENGISHFLKSSLFDQINRILYRFFPDEDRFWRAIGIGRSGKTDWGLYLNGVLVVVVELKPHIILNQSEMQELIQYANGKKVSSAWAKSSKKTENVFFQTYAQFTTEEARSSVKYAVLLNESYRPQSNTPQVFYSTAVLVERGADVLKVANRILTDGSAPMADEYPARPGELLLALSLMHRDAYAPPPFHNPPRPPVPSSAVSFAAPPQLRRSLRISSSTRDGEAEPSAAIRNNDGYEQNTGHGDTHEPGDSSDPRIRDTPQRRRHLQRHRGAYDTCVLGIHVTSAPPRLDLSPTDGKDGTFPFSDAQVGLGSQDVSSSYGSNVSSYNHFTSGESMYSPNTSPGNDRVEAIRLDQFTSSHVIHVKFIDEDVRPYGRSVEVMELCGPLEASDIMHRVTLPSLVGRPRCLPEHQPMDACIGRLRGVGALWTVYDFVPSVKDSFVGEQRVVLKLAIPSVSHSDDQHVSGAYNTEQAAAAVLHESQLMLGALKDLQGEMIPNLFGILVAQYDGMDTWSMVVEDCGDPISLAGLQPRHRRAIVALYTRLHRHGVLHNDVSINNILQRSKPSNFPSRWSDETLVINDFERSMTRQQFYRRHPADDWTAACDAEMDKVCHLIGLQAP